MAGANNQMQQVVQQSYTTAQSTYPDVYSQQKQYTDQTQAVYTYSQEQSMVINYPQPAQPHASHYGIQQ